MQEPGQIVTSLLGRAEEQCIQICQHNLFIHFKLLSRHNMRAVDIRKSCRWFLQIQCIRVNPARFLDLTPSRSRMYCTKSVHSKAHSCRDSLHPWSTLHAHPSLPGKSCTHSSVPKARAVVNWKKAAHLQGRATEQCISFWRGHAKLFVVLTLSLRTASFLRQWHFLEPKLMKSSKVKPTSLLCHIPDWEVRRFSPSLKKPPKEARQRCNDTFYYSRHLQTPDYCIHL